MSTSRSLRRRVIGSVPHTAEEKRRAGLVAPAANAMAIVYTSTVLFTQLDRAAMLVGLVLIGITGTRMVQNMIRERLASVMVALAYGVSSAGLLVAPHANQWNTVGAIVGVFGLGLVTVVGNQWRYDTPARWTLGLGVPMMAASAAILIVM